MTRRPAPATTEAPAAPSETARRRRVLGYTLLAALSYIPPLRTAPGKVAADTKQYLYLDPTRLLERAPSMWDPNIGLGTVTHQNIGYLFPM
ncbi:MAG TPA: alpha-(1-_3)-arabinofuranosyltransferase family protein, partial [Acidimicrobiia bacterium]|nr:alpha-(1->3)-arabinofuranosyltransferase family protein [Acidimicrobiia bacterium]